MEKVSYSQSGAFPGVSQFIPNYSPFIPKALYPRKADVLKKYSGPFKYFYGEEGQEK